MIFLKWQIANLLCLDRFILSGYCVFHSEHHQTSLTCLLQSTVLTTDLRLRAGPPWRRRAWPRLGGSCFGWGRLWPGAGGGAELPCPAPTAVMADTAVFRRDLGTGNSRNMDRLWFYPLVFMNNILCAFPPSTSGQVQREHISHTLRALCGRWAAAASARSATHNCCHLSDISIFSNFSVEKF